MSSNDPKSNAAWWQPHPGEFVRREDEEPTYADDSHVRPFILTRGRTQPLHDGLRIETLVYAAPAALSAPLQFEGRSIVEMCQTPLSVAEVAVRLRTPLGVARVLIADLVAERYLTVQESTALPRHIIERIRDRVRAL